MRVLVTGASGHVGAAIAARLRDAGHEVVGLSRRAQGPDGVARLEGDISSPDEMARVAREKPCEAVVHAAAEIAEEAAIDRVNREGTRRVVELAAGWSSTRFLFLSSVPVIGRPRELPVTEDHPVDPPSAYHASKLHGEQVTAEADWPGLCAASLRLTSPAGAGMAPQRVLPTFVRTALAGEPLEVAGKGTRAQDHVHVRDVADGVLACLVAGASGLFNLASGRATTNVELARRCVEVLGSSSEVRLGGRPDPDEGVRWEVSIERAARSFGYAPSRSLEDSIEAVAEGGLDAGLASAISRSPRRPEFRK